MMRRDHLCASLWVAVAAGAATTAAQAQPAAPEPLPLAPPPPPPLAPPPKPIADSALPAAAVTPAASPPSSPELVSEQVAEPTTGYDKGFFIRSADNDFLLRIGARGQLLFSYRGHDGDEDEYHFGLRRVRLVLTGHAFTEDLRYKLHAHWDSGGMPGLKDWLVDYRVIDSVLHLRTGQQKKPFGREWISSTANLVLVDRSIAFNESRGGRDIGVTVHNGFEQSPTVEYAVGLYNGSGELALFSEPGKGTNVPDQLDPLVVARLGYNYGDGDGYGEVDLDGGAPRFGIAASAQVRMNADEDGDAYIVTGGDFYFKASGLSSTGGAYLRWGQDGDQFKDQSYELAGMHAQLGYLVADRLVPGLRYSRVFRDGPDNDSHEITGGLSVLAYQHKVKVQLDGGALLTDAPEGQISDFLIRSQFQLSF